MKNMFKNISKNFAKIFFRDWGKANKTYENQHTIYTSHIVLYKGLKNLRFSEKNVNLGNKYKGKNKLRIMVSI